MEKERLDEILKAHAEWLKTNVCTAAEMGEDIAYAKIGA